MGISLNHGSFRIRYFFLRICQTKLRCKQSWFALQNQQIKMLEFGIWISAGGLMNQKTNCGVLTRVRNRNAKLTNSDICQGMNKSRRQKLASTWFPSARVAGVLTSVKPITNKDARNWLLDLRLREWLASWFLWRYLDQKSKIIYNPTILKHYK